ncbi:MAG: hypothetical protein ACREX4_23140 [Gammaproteobacteria bacterium]
MEAESSYQKPTPEWDYWTRLDRWNLHDAILLLLELEPRARDGEVIWRIVQEHRSGYIDDRFSKDPRLAILGDATRYYEWAWASYSARKLRLIVDIGGRRPARVDPADWLAWAENKTIAIPEPLRVLSGTRTQQPSSNWPRGDYETELLRKLAQAGTKFWRLYDPSDPSTAPTNEQVSKWLEDEGVSKRVAEVMAQILRADGLPTGPRK